MMLGREVMNTKSRKPVMGATALFRSPKNSSPVFRRGRYSQSESPFIGGMNPGTPSKWKGFIGGFCNITNRKCLNGFIRLHALDNLRNFTAGWPCRMDHNPGFPGLNKTNTEGYGQKEDAAAAGTPRRSPSKGLLKYCKNLTKLPKVGKLNPVVGRPEQIQKVIQILGRRTKRNPCLVGEFGVGKKFLVEGLAQQIVNGDIPENIQSKTVITLDIDRVTAGKKYRSDFEVRLDKLIKEFKRKRNNNVILFIDDVHRFIGGDYRLDVKHTLKRAIARGELQCIGATTPDKYKQYIEDDAELERYFERVEVPECTIDETMQILKGLRERYQIHHKLLYTNGSLVAAAQLSDQHMDDSYLPYKAIDLIDAAGSVVQIRHQKITKQKGGAVEAQMSALSKEGSEHSVGNDGPVVTELDIQQVLSSLTGKPLTEGGSDLGLGVCGGGWRKRGETGSRP